MPFNDDFDFDSNEPAETPAPVDYDALEKASRYTSDDVRRLTSEAAQKHGVPEDLLLKVAKQESGFEPAARSPKGAIGPMQLMPLTAKELGVDPHDPAQNIDGGARYLAQMLKRYNGDQGKALAAYNAGPGRVDSGKTLPRETQNYVKSITGKAPAAVDYDDLERKAVNYDDLERQAAQTDDGDEKEFTGDINDEPIRPTEKVSRNAAGRPVYFNGGQWKDALTGKTAEAPPEQPAESADAVPSRETLDLMGKNVRTLAAFANQKRAELEAEGTRLGVLTAPLNEHGQKTAASMGIAPVAPVDPAEIDAFNEKLHAHDALVGKLQESIDNYRTQVDAYNGGLEAKNVPIRQAQQTAVNPPPGYRSPEAGARLTELTEAAKKLRQQGRIAEAQKVEAKAEQLRTGILRTPAAADELPIPWETELQVAPLGRDETGGPRTPGTGILGGKDLIDQVLGATVAGAGKLASGVEKMAEPAQAIAADIGRTQLQGMGQPQSGAPALTADLAKQGAQGASDALSGAFALATPAVAAHFLAAPVQTALGLGMFSAVDAGTKATLEAAGVPDEYRDLFGQLAGIAAGSIPFMRMTAEAAHNILRDKFPGFWGDEPTSGASAPPPSSGAPGSGEAPPPGAGAGAGTGQTPPPGSGPGSGSSQNGSGSGSSGPNGGAGGTGSTSGSNGSGRFNGRRPSVRAAFAALGLEEDALWDDVKAAYRKIAIENHPDKANEGADPEKLLLANAAFKVLTEDFRANPRAERARNTPPPPPRPGQAPPPPPRGERAEAPPPPPRSAPPPADEPTTPPGSQEEPAREEPAAAASNDTAAPGPIDYDELAKQAGGSTVPGAPEASRKPEATSTAVDSRGTAPEPTPTITDKAPAMEPPTVDSVAEPWQMTHEEYSAQEHAKEQQKADQALQIAQEKLENGKLRKAPKKEIEDLSRDVRNKQDHLDWTNRNAGKRAAENHRELVGEAVAAGKPVPEHVLAGHPVDDEDRLPRDQDVRYTSHNGREFAYPREYYDHLDERQLRGNPIQWLDLHDQVRKRLSAEVPNLTTDQLWDKLRDFEARDIQGGVVSILRDEINRRVEPDGANEHGVYDDENAAKVETLEIKTKDRNVYATIHVSHTPTGWIAAASSGGGNGSGSEPLTTTQVWPSRQAAIAAKASELYDEFKRHAGRTDNPKSAKPHIEKVIKWLGDLTGGHAPAPGDSVAGADVHKNSSTQANMPPEVSDQVRAFGASIPDAELNPNEEHAREPEPHVTVKYRAGDDSAAITKLLEGEGPVSVKLGKASVFQNEDGDVLKVDVDSPDLHRLNGKIAKEHAHPDDYPEYKPHVTIAYLKKGEGQKYTNTDIPGVTGKTVTLNSITFSGKDGKTVEIPLKGSTAASPKPDLYSKSVRAEAAKEKGSATGRVLNAIADLADKGELPAALDKPVVIGTRRQVSYILKNYHPPKGVDSAKRTAESIVFQDIGTAGLLDPAKYKAAKEAIHQLEMDTRPPLKAPADQPGTELSNEQPAPPQIDFPKEGTAIIIPCSKTKLPGVHIPAEQIYTGDYFKSNLAYARANGAKVFILSAKYGLITPEERISDYDLSFLDDKPIIDVENGTHIPPKGPGPVKAEKLVKQIAEHGLDKMDRWVVLGGKEYRGRIAEAQTVMHHQLGEDPNDEETRSKLPEIIAPTAGMGIGKAKQHVKQNTPAPEDSAPAGPIPSGTWMNAMEIDQAVERFKNHPVLSRATKFLADFAEETNDHSDGWHSWPLPGHAAKQLMGMIQHPEYATEANFKKALGPIRAFYTKRGDKAGMKFPEIAPIPEGASTEIPPPHSYVKPITRPLAPAAGAAEDAEAKIPASTPGVREEMARIAAAFHEDVEQQTLTNPQRKALADEGMAIYRTLDEDGKAEWQKTVGDAWRASASAAVAKLPLNRPITDDTKVWEMAPNQFLEHRRDQALAIPDDKAFLRTPLEEWDTKRVLALDALTVQQIQGILKINGLPISGTKAEIQKRIFDNGKFRKSLEGKTPEQLVAENDTEGLNKMIRFVGAPMLGNKKLKAQSILGHVRAQRSRGEHELATANYKIQVFRAAKAGEPIPDEVFDRWQVPRPEPAAPAVNPHAAEDALAESARAKKGKGEKLTAAESAALHASNARRMADLEAQIAKTKAGEETAKPAEPARVPKWGNLTELEAEILQNLERPASQSTILDYTSHWSKSDDAPVLETLATLEQHGLIKKTDGDQYVRTEQGTHAAGKGPRDAYLPKVSRSTEMVRGITDKIVDEINALERALKHTPDNAHIHVVKLHELLAPAREYLEKLPDLSEGERKALRSTIAAAEHATKDHSPQAKDYFKIGDLVTFKGKQYEVGYVSGGMLRLQDPETHDGNTRAPYTMVEKVTPTKDVEETEPAAPATAEDPNDLAALAGFSADDIINAADAALTEQLGEKPAALALVRGDITRVEKNGEMEIKVEYRNADGEYLGTVTNRRSLFPETATHPDISVVLSRHKDRIPGLEQAIGDDFTSYLKERPAPTKAAPKKAAPKKASAPKPKAVKRPQPGARVQIDSHTGMGGRPEDFGVIDNISTDGKTALVKTDAGTERTVPLKDVSTSTRPMPEPPKARDPLEDAADQAEQRMRDRLNARRDRPAFSGQPQSKLDKQDLIDLTTMGAKHMVVDGATNFEDFTRLLTHRVGDLVQIVAESAGMTTDAVLRQIYQYATATAARRGVTALPLPPFRADAPTGAVGLIDAVYQKLKAGGSLGNVTELNALAEKHFGSSRTSGEWTPKDAFDAMEAGINRWLLDRGAALLEMPYADAMKELRGLMERVTSQGIRTEEQIKNQQFSTPPTEAFTAVKAAALRPDDVMMEPSAGNGGIAVFAKAIGAKVHVNEISDRRRKMLEAIGFTGATAHDGEIINSLLDRDVKPTVVVMNPPFSAGTVKSGEARNSNIYGFNHVDSALQRLAPGGRLVAILGGGRADDTNGGASLSTGPSGKWFERIAEQYNVRANIRIHGREYQKYGTSFATRIIVIDKDGPTPSRTTAGTTKTWESVVQGNAETLEEAYNLLSGVAASRPAADLQAGPVSIPGVGNDESGTGVGAGAGDGAAGDRGVQPGGNRPSPPDGLDHGSREPSRGDGSDEPGEGDQQPALRGPDTQPAGNPGDGTPESAGSGAANGDEQRPLEQPETLNLDRNTDNREPEQEDSAAYVTYRPTLKGPAHPGDIVETKTMATVPMPEISYRPNLPASVLEKGGLSAVQLEAISIAGQQNSIVLPGGSRASALIGDGTGVGKGRISAGILWDNYRQGRKRLVWVSEKWDLMQDAMRDLKGIGATELLRGVEEQEGRFIVGPNSGVKAFQKFGATAEINHDGVLFSTYALIRSADKKGNRRVAQLERYLRGNDDGEGAYILFDESHNLKNAVASMGGQVSQIGTAVKELLERMPKLRTASLSATAATDVVNLGYLDRLGLWGPGTAFPNGFREFQTQVAPGGMAAMELIARELKAQGKYVSRTLSFKGVTYDEAEHEVTPEQKELYRTAAKAWRLVLDNAAGSIRNTTNGGGRQLGKFMSQFYGAQQRFFNLLISTLKIPTALKLANQALAENKSVVITLVNTNEAAQNREKNKARDLDDSDDPIDYDFGPKEMLVQMVRDHYPVQQYRDDVDSSGNPIKVPVYRIDKDGRELPVNNPAAEEAREALIAQINAELHMPENPLDILVQSLGGEKKVAELTGRKERYDQSTGKFVKRGDPNAKAAEINLFEMRAFQGGKKRVAVLSGAAGTGISLHAGRDVKNQQKRYHITLQVGWSADKQMQMFGRTHRTNQVHPPEYVMLVSDLGGERRFVSTIARRLGSLGALTKGQKNASSGSDLMEKVNFETDQGRQSTNSFYAGLLTDIDVPGTGLTGMQILHDLNVLKMDGGSLTVPLEDRQNVTKLLNRLLALDPDHQNGAYNYFYDIFTATVKDAIERGQLDTGVKTLPGDEFAVKESRAIAKDPKTAAETFYYPVDAKVRNQRLSPEDLDKRMAQTRQQPTLRRAEKGALIITHRADPIVRASGATDAAVYVANAGNGRWVKYAEAELGRYQEVGAWAQRETEKAQREADAAKQSVESNQESVERSTERQRNEPVAALQRQLKVVEARLSDLENPPAADIVLYNSQRYRQLWNNPGGSYSGSSRYGRKRPSRPTVRLENLSTRSQFDADPASVRKIERPTDVPAAIEQTKREIAEHQARIQEAEEAAKSFVLPEDDYSAERLKKSQEALAEKEKALAEAQAISADPQAWARQEWAKQYEASPTHTVKEHHLIGGAVMRYWNPLKDATYIRNSIYTTSDSTTGERVVGIDIPASAIRGLLARITGGGSTVNAEQLYTDVRRNNLTYTLEGNIQVRRTRVARTEVIQLIPPTQDLARDLERLGAVVEKGVTTTIYIPENWTSEDSGQRTRTILNRILDRYPVKADEPTSGDDDDSDTPALGRLFGKKKPLAITAEKLKRVNEVRGGGKGIFVKDGKVIDMGDELHAQKAEKFLPGTLFGDAVAAMLKTGAVRARGEEIELYDRALNGMNLFPAVEHAAGEARRKRASEIGLDVHASDGSGLTHVSVPLSDIGDLLANPRVYVRRHADSRPAFGRAIPGFYSGLERTIEAKMPEKASAAQVEAIVRNPQSGVKADEVKWSDLGDWLKEQKGAVTKKDVLDFLKANNIQVEEVEKGKPDERRLALLADAAALGTEWSKLNTGLNELRLQGNYDGIRSRLDRIKAIEAKQAGIQRKLKALPPDNSAKHGQHVLPGGEKYRELLLTLPVKAESAVWTRVGTATPYTSTHWAEPNVVAHVRFDERTGPNGEKLLHVAEIQSDWHQVGRKKGYREGSNGAALKRLDEEHGAASSAYADGIQDLKWGKADASGERPYSAIQRGTPEWAETMAAITAAERAKKAAWDEITAIRKADAEKVPAAPFAKTWHELAFRRMLRYAAENGYDQLTWDTGAINADRYDLSKLIRRVVYEPAGPNYAAKEEGGFTKLWIEDNDSNMLQEDVAERVSGAWWDEEGKAAVVPNEKLPDVIGKELADKMMAGEGESDSGFDIFNTANGDVVDNYHREADARHAVAILNRQGGSELHDVRPARATAKRFEGLDLKVGGEGMVGFYDKILPAYAAKYGKKWGAKVATTEIKTPVDENVLRPEGEPAPSGTTTVHSIDITPAMRKSVMDEGQPLFGRHHNAGAPGAIAAELRGDTLFTTPAGMEALAGAFGTSGIYGAMLEPRHSANAVRKLRAAAAEPGAPEGLASFANAIEHAAKQHPNLVVASRDAGSIKDLKARLRHERMHSAQAQAAGMVRNHLGKHEQAFLDHPVAQMAAVTLKAMGYRDNELASEIGAHLAGGQWDDLNLDEDEATELWNAYLDAFAAEHGARALQAANNVAPMLRGALRDAERRRREGGGASPSGDSQEGPEAAAARREGAGSQAQETQALERPGFSFAGANNEPPGNYSWLGAKKDTYVRNLSQLEKADPEAHAAAVKAATSRAQASALIRAAVPRIVEAMKSNGGGASWLDLRRALIESNLRGARQRWLDMAQSAVSSTDEDLADAVRGWLMPILKLLHEPSIGVALPSPAQTAIALLDRGDFDGLRAYLEWLFEHAADRVAVMMPDAEFQQITGAPGFQAGLDVYKRLVEKALARSHRDNDGVFVDPGPLGAYYPLVRLDEDGETVQRGGKRTGRAVPYRNPGNIDNVFRTGLGEAYDPGMEALNNKIRNSFRVNNKASLLDTLEGAGLLQKIARGQEAPDTITYHGIEYAATPVEIQKDRDLITPTGVVHIPQSLGVIPSWLEEELRPILDKKHLDLHDPSSLIGKITKFTLAGPLDAVIHSSNLIGTLVANTPFIGKSLAAKAAGNFPFSKRAAATLSLITTNPTNEEAARDIIAMAQLGLVPEKYGSVASAWFKNSRNFAEDTGAELEKGFGPFLYGPRGIDIRARLLMYRMAKRMNPGATPTELYLFTNQLGNYTRVLQGKVERLMKESGWSPFYTAGSTMARNGVNSWTGRGPMPKKGAGLRALAAITGGAVGMIGLWVLANKAYTGKWPWEDPHSKFMSVRLNANDRKSPFAIALWGPPSNGDAYIDVGFFSPIVKRGARALGIAGMFDAHQGGASADQMMDAAVAGAINAAMHPVMGPPATAAWIGISGTEPYLTGLRDDKGRPMPQFLPAVKRQKPGAAGWAKQHLLAPVVNMNGFLANVAGATGLTKGVIEHADDPANHWLRMMVDLATPQLFAHPSNTLTHAEFLARQRAALVDIDRAEAKSQISTAVRDRDMDRARDLVQRGLRDGKLTAEDVRHAVRRSRVPKDVAQFESLPLPAALDIMELANDEEKQRFIPPLIHKLKRGFRELPEGERPHVIQQLKNLHITAAQINAAQ